MEPSSRSPRLRRFQDPPRLGPSSPAARPGLRGGAARWAGRGGAGRGPGPGRRALIGPKAARTRARARCPLPGCRGLRPRPPRPGSAPPKAPDPGGGYSRMQNALGRHSHSHCPQTRSPAPAPGPGKHGPPTARDAAVCSCLSGDGVVGAEGYVVQCTEGKSVHPLQPTHFKLIPTLPRTT